VLRQGAKVDFQKILPNILNFKPDGTGRGRVAAARKPPVIAAENVVIWRSGFAGFRFQPAFEPKEPFAGESHEDGQSLTGR